MPTQGHDAISSAQAVAAALTAGLRRRRLRSRTRRVWQVAPFVAAAALAVAALSALLGWPSVMSLAVLAAGGGGLAVHLLLAFPSHRISDDLASAIDREAGLGGELRSASWFAARTGRDPWADEHVVRAARRVQEIDWTQIYPPVRAGRSGVTTAVLTVAAIALSALFPGSGADTAAAPVQRAAHDDAERTVRSLDHVPPELLKQLAQLLAAAEAGNRAATEALSGNRGLRDTLTDFARLDDPQLLEALARALTDAQADQQTVDAMEALAERLRRAAEAAGMSAAMQDALEQLADQMQIATPERTAGRASAAADDPLGAGDPRAGGATGGLEQLAIQFVEERNAAGGAGIMVFSGRDADDGSGAPGAGVGGSPSGDIPPGTMADIEVALGREVVAAHQDAPGANVETDRHLQTGQGQAEATFTRGTAAAFEGAPLAAPPPVPETRRSDVRTYFVRSPR